MDKGKGKATADPDRGSVHVRKRGPSFKSGASPPKKKTKTKPKQKRQKAIHAEKVPTETVEYKDITDPTKVDLPITYIVHPNLDNAWAIDKGNPMWFIFDVHSPARHFKRQVRYDPKEEFPPYSEPPHEDLTETDETETDETETDETKEDKTSKLMPFAPWAVEYAIHHAPFHIYRHYHPLRKNYVLKCDITPERFMSWKRFETRTVMVGIVGSKWRNGERVMEPNSPLPSCIPAPYDRIVAQLIAEDEHAEHDDSHEAVRRQSYARRVLNSFWMEIREYRYETGPLWKFRPKSLTPLLQRQLAGVEENYSPSVRESVSQGNGTPTIEQATHFYLRDDPTIPRWIPNFRRNLIYIPEARWHLGVVLGVHAIGDPQAFEQVRRNSDLITKNIQKQAENGARNLDTNDEQDNEYSDEEEIDSVDIPRFNDLEVSVIVNERLEKFFAPELELVVRVSCCRITATITVQRRGTQPLLLAKALAVRNKVATDAAKAQARIQASPQPIPSGSNQDPGPSRLTIFSCN